MSLRRQLVVSMLVQGIGAASVLLATLWLGTRLGPEQQGEFSRTKAEVEFVAALAMFGLPQALFYFVKSGRLNGRSALRWAAGSALLAVPVGATYALTQHRGPAALLVLGMACAVGVCVLHGQLRALMLLHPRTEWFNAVTAWPQVVLLAGVLATVAAGVSGEVAWAWLFALAFGSSSALACWRIGASTWKASFGGPVGWRELGRFGLATWLTSAMATASVLLMQRWVEGIQGPAGLGRFTMAMLLVQVPLTPVAYAAPLLLRRWMEQPGLQASRRWALVLFAGLSASAAALWLLAPAWPDLGLGIAYADLTRAFAVLMVGGAAEAALRLLAVGAQARGIPWIAVQAEGARAALLLAGWWLLPSGGLLVMCALWSGAALAAAAVFAWHARRVSGPVEGRA